MGGGKGRGGPSARSGDLRPCHPGFLPRVGEALGGHPRVQRPHLSKVGAGVLPAPRFPGTRGREGPESSECGCARVWPLRERASVAAGQGRWPVRAGWGDGDPGAGQELAPPTRWPKYWSISFSISPSKEYLGLISFRIDWLDLFPVQGSLKSLLQHHSSKHQFFGAQLSSQSNSHIHT